MARGAIAHHNCVNPDCLAIRGERHDPECTPDDSPTPPETTWSGPEDWG